MKLLSAIFVLAVITLTSCINCPYSSCKQSADPNVPPCPVFIRVHNFIVNPSTGPVLDVTVTNQTDTSFTGEVSAEFPEGWIIAPAKQTISLEPNASTAYTCVIKKAAEIADNVYPIVLTVTSEDKTWTLNRQIVTASAPYFRPAIDGKLDEWQNDSIPVTMTTNGKKSVIRAYWNKKKFCVAVEVQEDQLTGLDKLPAGNGIDAIQIALAPQKALTPTTAEAEATRYEFLIAANGTDDNGTCYQLMKPGDNVGQAATDRVLTSLEAKGSIVKVVRNETTTIYEIELNIRAMSKLRATAGREFCMSVLIHDPDGVGVRDLGTIMNLPPNSNNPLAWSKWKGAKWPKQAPLDNKIEFGFCSSIH